MGRMGLESSKTPIPATQSFNSKPLAMNPEAPTSPKSTPEILNTGALSIRIGLKTSFNNYSKEPPCN